MSPAPIAGIPRDPAARALVAAEIRQWRSPYVLLVPEGTTLLEGARDALLAGMTPTSIAAYGVTRTMNAEGRPVSFDTLPERIRDRRGIEGAAVVSWRDKAETHFPCFVFRDPVGPGPVLVAWSTGAKALGGFRTERGGDWWWEFTARLSTLGGFAFVDQVVAEVPEPPEEEEAVRRMRIRQTRQWIAEIEGLWEGQQKLADLCVRLGGQLDG